MTTAARAALEDQIKARAHRFGFDLVGITTADPAETGEQYAEWAAAGRAGEMGYMSRDPERRRDPAAVMPDARSIVVVGMLYNTGELDAGLALTPAPADAGTRPLPMLGVGESMSCSPLPALGEGPGVRARGRIARYALGDDYHEVMSHRLNALLAWIQDREGHPVCGRAYVDTGPLLERDLARRAGLGWFGKNTNLLNVRLGSYFFLGALLLDLPLTPDPPFAGHHCGTCTRCLDACPTGAFVGPYVLDARRCISYLTIELKGPIPRELRPLIGDWIYGCDICQEVCPWNRKAPLAVEPAFRARAGLTLPELIPLLNMTQNEFSRHFKNSPIKRAKRRGLLRNVAVALGNAGDRAAVPALAAALHDPEPLVRGHAAWALGRLGGEDARASLLAASAVEEDPMVREELALAIAELDGTQAEPAQVEPAPGTREAGGGFVIPEPHFNGTDRADRAAPGANP
jgi:epoxyqueuosine reductase